MVQQTHSLEAFQQDFAEVETTQEGVVVSIKKKKNFIRFTYIKVKVFFWNLSPTHWFDDMKNIKITLEEFECKKR